MHVFLHTILILWTDFFPINFGFETLEQISNYEKEIEEMKHMTRQEYVASLRRWDEAHYEEEIIYVFWLMNFDSNLPYT